MILVLLVVVGILIYLGEGAAALLELIAEVIGAILD